MGAGMAQQPKNPKNPKPKTNFFACARVWVCLRFCARAPPGLQFHGHLPGAPRAAPACAHACAWRRPIGILRLCPRAPGGPPQNSFGDFPAPLSWRRVGASFQGLALETLNPHSVGVAWVRICRQGYNPFWTRGTLSRVSLGFSACRWLRVYVEAGSAPKEAGWSPREDPPVLRARALGLFAAYLLLARSQRD